MKIDLNRCAIKIELHSHANCFSSCWLPFPLISTRIHTLRAIFLVKSMLWLHCVISTARLTSEVKGNALDYYRVPTKELVTAVEKASNGWRMDVSPLKYVWHHCDISLSCSKFKSRVEMHHLSAVKYGMQSFLPAVAKGQLISEWNFGVFKYP